MLHQMLLEQRRKAFEQGGDFGFVEHPGGDEQLARRHGRQRKVRFDGLLNGLNAVGFDAVFQRLAFVQVVIAGRDALGRSEIRMDSCGMLDVRTELGPDGGVDGGAIGGVDGCGRTRSRIADRLSGIRSHRDYS